MSYAHKRRKKLIKMMRNKHNLILVRGLWKKIRKVYDNEKI